MASSPYIRDLEGNLIEVTDLNEAIMQTAGYICILYQQQEPALLEFAKKRQRYWKDIFQKLGRLKAKLEAGELNQLSTGGFPPIKEQS